MVHDMEQNFEKWLGQVRSTLLSFNMPLERWQERWEFDFAAEFNAGIEPARAAEKANRFWWYEQNRALGQECRLNSKCWLPNGHSQECQPV